MRKLARKRVLEFGGIVSLVALLALTGFQFPVQQAPVDWRKTTVEGFPAGIEKRIAADFESFPRLFESVVRGGHVCT